MINIRYGIRSKLLDSNIGISECYEPNIPNRQTPKPYAVVVENDDTKNNDIVGFKRNIEIWFYDERLSFKNLDQIAKKAIEALNMQTIEDTKTNEIFTCVFDGIIENDIVDEEWDSIAKGLSFTVIALHEEDEVNTDTWLDALSEYTKDITNHTVYLNSWKKNFEVPSILWRVKDSSKERENFALIKESKTLICHIASNNKNEINELLDNIEDNLITDLKIPLDLADKRYLTIESISEDREADMLSKGQLIVKFFRRRMIKNDTPNINSIHGSGKLKEE